MRAARKKRLGWVDNIRFWAFLIVFTRHYIESFFPEYAPEKVGGSLAFLAHGLTGKGAVALFFVLSGYFVAASVAKYSTSTYIVHRYLYLACHLFVANFIAATFVALFTIVYPLKNSFFLWGTFDAALLWKWFFNDSIFFTYNLVPTYWCVPLIFVSSIVIFLIQKITINVSVKKRFKIWAALFILLVISLVGTWIAISFLGALLWTLNRYNPPVLHNKIVLAVSAILCFFLYRIPTYQKESYLEYLLWGLASFLFLLLCFRIQFLQKALSVLPLRKGGQLSFALYLVHPLIMNTAMLFFFSAANGLFSKPLLFCVGYVLCLVLCFLAANWLQYSAEWLQKIFLNRILSI